MRILLVEDNRGVAHQVARRIRSAGFSIDHVDSIRLALESAATRAYAVAVLDRRLPDGDGLTIVPELRRLHPSGRVLVLTAVDAVVERVAGLNGGADDYMTKPFDLEELVARIHALLRRTTTQAAPPIVIGRLSVNFDTRTVAVAGRPALLHQRELALLEALARRARLMVRRETLMDEIWGWGEDIQPHALTALVARLRVRLDELTANVQIHAARGVGYMITEKRE